jgi:hypothetical protein
MRTLVRLLIAGVIVHAAVRGGQAAWTYFHFKDEAQQIIRFSPDSSETELHDRILAKAEELQVPIAPDDIEVHKDDRRSEAWAAYTQPVELLPRYPVPVKIAFRVEADIIRPGAAGALGR